MTIEELEQQATAIMGGTRGWQRERIVALCLEFAGLLAKAVEVLDFPVAGSSYVFGALHDYTECPECFTELPLHAEHCPVKPALDLAAQVLVALSSPTKGG